MIRQGSDITLVGWGAQLAVMEQACADAEKVRLCMYLIMSPACSGNSHVTCSILQDGISCELIDLRTLIPWDKEMVEASVKKTGRLLVIGFSFITFVNVLFLLFLVNQLRMSKIDRLVMKLQ